MKKEITGKTLNGDELTVYVKSPNPTQLRKAQIESARVYKEAIDAGCFTKKETDKILRSRNLWGDEQSKRLQELSNQIIEDEKKLKAGKIKLWSEARPIAIRISNNRREQMLLLRELNQLENLTAEGMATDARFDYLCSVCAYTDEGESVFTDVEDYKNRYQSSEDLTVKITNELSNIIYDYDPDWEKKLPEQEFLRTHKMIDENGNFLNKEGQLVDSKLEKVEEEPIIETTDWSKVEFEQD